MQGHEGKQRALEQLQRGAVLEGVELQQVAAQDQRQRRVTVPVTADKYSSVEYGIVM